MKTLIKSFAVALMLLIVGGSAYSFSYFAKVDLNSSLAVAFGFVSIALVLGEVGVLGVITQNPWIGRAKQSAGSMTLTTWKGKNVMKTKPLSVENPNTVGQQAQRSVLRQMVAIYRQISAMIQIGFKQQAIGMSEYNAFLKANMDEAFDVSVPPTATLDPTLLVMSKGTIFPTDMTSVTADVSDGDVVFSWPTTPLLPGQAASDLHCAIGYNETTDDWQLFDGSTARSAGTYTQNLPTGWVAGNTVQFYSFFANAALSKSSDSTLDTVTVVA